MRFFFLILVSGSLAAATPAPRRLALEPVNPLLFGRGTTQLLAVAEKFGDGSEREITAGCSFHSSRPSVATVDEKGVVRAEADGASLIRARCGANEVTTTVLVQRAAGPVKPGFQADIMPILTKLGCNGGSCHGALKGQSGFKLSLFGYEPGEDYEMIVRKHDGRRLNLNEPEQSLLLRKPAFEVKHGGGKLLRKGSDEYNMLAAWIRAGAKMIRSEERNIVSLRLQPSSAVLAGKDATRRLLVTALYSDGTERDVTRQMKFQSNDESIAAVSIDGTVSAARAGETAIVVRAPGLAVAARFGVVLERRRVAPVPSFNFIDDHVFAKLRSLQIPPSDLCDDASFLRRAYLDIIGVIPAADEVRSFLADEREDKRARLVDALLRRPEYADFWALYWGDHLNNTKQLLYNKGPYVFTRWLHDAFRRNLPYDEFARELLTSSGPMFDSAAANFYPLMKKEMDLASITSQLFLGVSIECARCHNHPLEKWKQDDFNGMAAFFSQVRYKNGTGPRNNERTLYVDFERHFQNPDTKRGYWPKPLGGDVLTPDGSTDRRELLADWMTSPRNPFFARAVVNRMWRNFMGRGLVEPVDDFRDTNPATNAPLLNALAQDFIDHRFDLHHLIRRITASRAYQLSSIARPGNEQDKMAYSRRYPRRLTAEQLLDSISLATGVPEQFTSLYPGTRAAQLPEPEIESYFLEVFDRPSRQIICERKQPPTLNQALHLISGDTIQTKITDARGVLSRWKEQPAESVVEEMYLRTLSRYPDAAERGMAKTAIAKASSPPRGYEDVFWALLNSREFLYNH
ncbi:MAG: DUF1549 domain-containing protein [Bryobacteraceae bacterium]